MNFHFQSHLLLNGWIHYKLKPLIAHSQEYDPYLMVVEEQLAQMWIELIFNIITFSLIEKVKKNKFNNLWRDSLPGEELFFP